MKLRVSDNIQFHYEIAGNEEKPFLFLVHGSPGSWIKFKKFLADKQMLDNFRMIVPDRPGYGFSEPGKGRTLGDQSLLLHSFLQKICEGEPVMAVGHSYGGSVVTRMAVDDQRRFSSGIPAERLVAHRRDAGPVGFRDAGRAAARGW